MEFVFVRAEEKMLEAQFGEAWLGYKNNVRKWF
jgi:protein-S-isoprenylcysteine O-methyltransferase Ste14